MSRLTKQYEDTKIFDLLGCSCEKCGAYLLLPKNEALSLEKGNCDCPYCEGEIVCFEVDEDE